MEESLSRRSPFTSRPGVRTKRANKGVKFGKVTGHLDPYTEGLAFGAGARGDRGRSGGKSGIPEARIEPVQGVNLAQNIRRHRKCLVYRRMCIRSRSVS